MSIPTSATSLGTSSRASRSAPRDADGEEVVRAEDRVGADAREQELGGAASGLDHEVVRDLDQLVVAGSPHERSPSR